MEVGLALPTVFRPGTLDPRLPLDLAADADAAGFRSLWVGDHVLWHLPCLEVFSTLAAVATRTTHARLGPGVLLLCLRPPVQAAQTLASLDHISGGRLIVGIGVGGEHPAEFAVSGVPRRERGRRTNAALQIALALWGGSLVTHPGITSALPNVTLQPPPLQRPAPPLWIGGRSEAALRRVLRFGEGWMPAFITPERYRESLDRLRVMAETTGRERPLTAAVYLLVSVAADRAAAQAAAADFLTTNYRMPFAPLSRYLAMGGPAECIERISNYRAAGVTHLICRFATFDPRDQFERFCARVLPSLG